MRATKTEAKEGDSETALPGDGRPTIGILTALPKEHAAMKVMLDNSRKEFGYMGTPYVVGTVPAADNGVHGVVVGLLTETGNNQAAVATTTMLRDFPTISEVVFVGIAGAVPDPQRVERHVRLGDVVVAGREGVVQYDLGKQKGTFERRPPPRPASAKFLTAVRHLESELLGGDSLSLALQRGSHLPNSPKPPPELDKLKATPPDNAWLEHPPDSGRHADEPRVFSGAIVSGNIVVKNAVLRDQLRAECRAMAIEMEGSGLADAAHAASVPYFVVRATCDYSDDEKNDIWQEYAALVAAAFLRRLLSGMVGLTEKNSAANRLHALGEALRRCLSANNVKFSLYVLMGALLGACCAGVHYQMLSSSTWWVSALVGVASVFVPLFWQGRLEWALERVIGSRSLLKQVESAREDLVLVIRQVQEFLDGCRKRCHHG